MVIAPSTPSQPGRARGSLSAELTVALGVLAVALLPLSVSFARDPARLHSRYVRAVALELVDGEMEVLAAGEWRAFPPGRHPYPMRAEAAANLPLGTFTLTRSDDRLRLEWRPAARGSGGPVVREVPLNLTASAASAPPP